ncbi:alpha-E domain-containing protein [Subdoligranulum variabile]|uniref:DUF403 domain-containing protein n=1 Tax=Subdoligranulum variabile DSM 15176 TaxID=411471 RepID=D1PIB8_9FIRM|nr:alpha-E domain-containing protein [Subdoligranulum variabile]EFB77586.1 hypothetical protein SUBVAR_04083 [Subdoligranulum variabile DSM 15176]UWP67187.1 alpha-E domain-containing protein [Subdoligranulum variabile]
MGPVTLSKQNRLYWLGRYAERVYMTVQLLMKDLDALLDGTGMDYADFCRRLGAENVYRDAEDFCRRYLFDGSQPCSAKASMEALLGNGMVLRETISTPTLSYLQMAESAMEMASRSEAPAVELQWVLDDIMAFRGSFDEAVDHEGVRNITKTGGTVERLSLMLRLGLQPERLHQEMRKLLNRLYKTDLVTDPEALQTITAYAVEETDVPKPELLRCVEGLFVV